MSLNEAQIAALPEALRRKFRDEQKPLEAAKPQEAPKQAVTETPAQPKPVIHNPDLREASAPASTEPPEQQEQPTPPPPDPWEQRYRVLKGKYDAEIPNLANQVRQLQVTVQAQADIIRGLKPVDQGQPKAEPPKPVQGAIKPLNPEDYGHLGEEGQTLAKTVNQLSAVIESQQAEMRQLRGTTETLSKNTDRVVQDFGATQHQTFLDSLKTVVPDCWEINERPDFRAWLDEPMTVETIAQNGQLIERTVKRDDILQAAQSSRNVSKIKRIFDEYKAQKSGQRTAPPPNGGGRPSPDLFIEPETAGRGPTQHTKPKKEPVTYDQLQQAAARARTLRTKEAIDAFTKLSSEYRANG